MVITVGKALVHGAFLLAGVGIGILAKLWMDHGKYDTVIPPDDKEGRETFEKAYAYYQAKKAGVIVGNAPESSENAPNTASNDDIKKYIDEKAEELKSMIKYVIGREDSIAKDATRIRNIEKMCECITIDQLESIMDDISAIKTVLEEVNLIEEEDYVNSTGGIGGSDRDEEVQDRSDGDREDTDGSRAVIGDRAVSEEDRRTSDSSSGSGRNDIRAERVEGEGDSSSGGFGRIQGSKEEKEEVDGGRSMNDEGWQEYDSPPDDEESPEEKERRQQIPAFEISEEEYEEEPGPGEPYRFKDDDFTYYLRSDVLATGNDIQDADEILTPEGHRILRMCDKEMTCYIRLEAIDTDFQIEVLDEEWPGD